MSASARRRGLLAPFAVALLAGCASVPSETPEPGRSPLEDVPRERQIMVTFQPAPSYVWSAATLELMSEHGLRMLAAWNVVSLRTRCVVFEAPGGRSIEPLLMRLRRDPRVDIAQRVQSFRVLSPVHDDPYFHLQRSVHEIRAGEAHRWATGSGVRVALVDTGVDIGHPDLQGRIVQAANFATRGRESFATDIHGTAVAGVIVAAAGNGVGIVGVAPEAELLALRACWPEEPASRQAVCDSYTLALALDFALEQRPALINMSLGGPDDPLLRRLVREALRRGIGVVAAASGRPGEEFPAGLNGVLAVGRAPAPGAEEPSFAQGPAGLVAPGTGVLTTVPGGGYDFLSGSSMAAAHATGVAALMLELEPDLKPDRLVALLLAGGRGGLGERDNPQPPQRYLDACGAVARVAAADC